MTRYCIEKCTEVPCPTNQRPIHDCDIGVYHCSRFNFHKRPRQQGRVCHCSLDAWTTITRNQELTHGQIMDNIFVCNQLDGLTVSVDNPSMPDALNTEVLFWGSNVLLFPDLFEIYSDHLIHTSVDTKDIPFHLDVTTVFSKLTSLSNVAPTRIGNQAVGDFLVHIQLGLPWPALPRGQLNLQCSITLHFHNLSTKCFKWVMARFLVLWQDWFVQYLFVVAAESTKAVCQAYFALWGFHYHSERIAIIVLMGSWSSRVRLALSGLLWPLWFASPRCCLKKSQ